MQDRTDVYQFIERFTRENGYSPSYEEIAKASGIASKSMVLRRLEVLKSEGLIDYVPGVPRTVHITQQSRSK